MIKPPDSRAHPVALKRPERRLPADGKTGDRKDAEEGKHEDLSRKDGPITGTPLAALRDKMNQFFGKETV